MTKLTAATLAEIAPEIAEALAGVAERHGIQFNLTNGAADREGLSGSFKLGLEAVDTETGMSAEQRLFELHAPRFGFAASDYGREIAYGRARYRLVGFTTSTARSKS